MRNVNKILLYLFNIIMFNGLNNKLSNVPTISGLSDISSDSVTSSSVDTDSLTVNGVDVTGVINQVPINTADIAGLKQITTGQTYTSVGDTTTFDNNVTLTSGKKMTMGYYQTQTNSSVNALNLGSKNGATIFMTYGAGLPNLTTGDYNVIMGGNIGSQLQGGNNNFALGYDAFNNNINGCNNCIMGHRAALGLGASGNFNTWYNTVIGDTALTNANDVAESTCIGWGTGNSMLNNNLKCTCIGAGADCADGLSYATAIGANVLCSTSNTVKIGRSADNTVFDGTVTLKNNLILASPATTLTQTELSYLDGATSNIQAQINAIPSTANVVTTNTTQTITGAKTFDGITTLNNDLVLTTPATTLTQTELSYLDGATSNIQAQINAIPSLSGYVTTNTTQTITGAKTFNGITTLNNDLVLTTPATTLTQTELSYLNGATSNIQAQINAIPSLSGYVTTNTDQTITGMKTFSQTMIFDKLGGNVAIGQNITAEFGFNNFTSGGSYKFNANTALAVPQEILNLSSGASEGIVNVKGNIQITSRAGGTAAVLTNSSSGVLTIQNTASGGITQIQNENSLGVTKTNLMLQTTKQTIGGDGTDFNVVLTGDATILTNKTMRLFSSGTNMYLDCGTGYTTGSTPLVFRNGAGTIARAVINDLGIDMTGCATCIYGRNDNYDFTLQPAGATTFPIGFTDEYNETAVTFTSGTAFNYTTVLPQLTNGVWQVNGTLQVDRGSGSYSGAPYIYIRMVAATGSSFYPSVGNGNRVILPTNTATPAIVPFTSTIIVKSASAVRAAIQGQIVMSVGTATKSLHIVFVKIA